MKSKKPSSAKVVDISRPKKRTALAETPSAPQLVIPKRSSLIIPITEEEEALEATTAAPAPEALKTRQTTKVVLPQTAPALPVTEPDQPPVAPAQEQAIPKPPVPAQPAVEQPAPTPPTPPQPTTPPQPPAPRVEPPQPKPAAEPQPAAKAPAAAEKSPEPENPDTNAKPAKGHANVQKALEDAKHQEEIQGYIDTHKFFVPINARARKRSLRVSIALTFVELILGLVLLNLMLDAGLIELLEKIPHTHFFSLQ